MGSDKSEEGVDFIMEVYPIKDAIVPGSQKSNHLKALEMNDPDSQESETSLRCKLCNATYKTQHYCEAHLLKHERKQKIKCNICSKSFLHNRFASHVMVHTGEKPFVCSVCGRGFRLNRDLKQHNYTHTGEKPYPCNICDKRFSDASARRKHYQVHTGEKPYSCELCQRAFSQISHLREHQVTHTKERIHTCEICNKKFTTKSSLQRHVSTHTNCCDICSETFTTELKLQRHKEMHDESRPYSCPYCTKRFYKKCDVTAHLIIHSTVKNILCKVCNTAFKSFKYLRVHHYQYHKGVETPYVCSVCNKGFFQETGLKRHAFIHIDEKRALCSSCGISFTTKEDKSRHSCGEVGVFYNCEYCERRYRHKSDLNKHVRKFHSDDD